MAGDWIKFRTSLPRDPRVVRISSALKADRLRTIGGLVSAWCLFDEQTEAGFLDGYTPELLDELVGLPGLSRAMEAVDWLVIGDGFLEVPRFQEHNGKSAKRRAQDSVRKMSAREADKCPQGERTNRGLEKRREDIEREGEADEWAKTKNQPTRPTLAQAKSAAGNAGVTEKEAEEWWLKRESSGWMKGTGGGGTTPVGSNWQADLKQFVNGERERKASNKPQNGKTGTNSSANRRVDRNAGTLNDPSEYAGL